VAAALPITHLHRAGSIAGDGRLPYATAYITPAAQSILSIRLKCSLPIPKVTPSALVTGVVLGVPLRATVLFAGRSRPHDAAGLLRQPATNSARRPLSPVQLCVRGRPGFRRNLGARPAQRPSARSLRVGTSGIGTISTTTTQQRDYHRRQHGTPHIYRFVAGSGSCAGYFPPAAQSILVSCPAAAPRGRPPRALAEPDHHNHRHQWKHHHRPGANYQSTDPI